MDLPSAPSIFARVENVVATNRCTRLGDGQGNTVQLVEHLLSALNGLGIDNCIVEVDGPELPIGDGSARFFVELLAEAGIKKLSALKKIIRIDRPIHWSEGDVHLIGLPAPHFQISYTLHYPQSTFIRSQFFSCSPAPQLYVEEIASARTFCLYEEIAPLIEKGILRGGTFEHGLVIRGNEVLNSEGVRFMDEMARHKVLDFIGDIALLGAALEGHVIAIRSGHASNVSFAKMIAQHYEEKLP